MAEFALYDNSNEPQFPFELVRTQLSWLPGYLSNQISDQNSDVEAYLNTILVFGRARTAALLHMGQWDGVWRLMCRLNAAAKSVRATHHRLELVQHGGMFFVTCSRSPRFIWRLPLSHCDTGRNLDYFAPGHNTKDPPEKKCTVSFIEKESLSAITSETVLLDALRNESTRNKFEEFNDARVNLFNSTMKRLGLHYQFKCLVVTPEVIESVGEVMRNPSPPLSSWWDDNCYFVNGFFFADVVFDLTLVFCGYGTKYDVYWELIQVVFNFVLKYKTCQYWYTSEETGDAHWKSMESLFHRIKIICEQDHTEDFAKVFSDICGELRSLAENADRSFKTMPASDFRRLKRPSFWRRTLYKFNCERRSITQIAKLYLLDRYKFNVRLVHRSVDYPASGDEIVFR